MEPLTCVLMCCSGAVTRLAQLSHNMTMMDRKRQAARIHRGRPERLQGGRGGRGLVFHFEAFKSVQGAADVSPGHAAEEVVLGRGVLCVLDGVLAFPACFTCPLPVTPHPYDPKEGGVKRSPTWGRVQVPRVPCSHRAAFGCGSGPGARVCPPRWTGGPAARGGSTPSPAGSEEGEKTGIKSAVMATR